MWKSCSLWPNYQTPKPTIFYKFLGEKAYILNTIGHQYQGSAFPETETKLIGSSCVQILGGGDVQEKPDKNHVLLGELCVTPSRDCQ